MSHYSQWSLEQQVNCFRKQFAQYGSLPFAKVLSAETVIGALKDLGIRCYNSTYNPVTVLRLFLGQMMHANPTLAVAVENFLAWRLRQGLPPCSEDTGAYSRARQRLPEQLLQMLTRQSGREMD